MGVGYREGNNMCLKSSYIKMPKGWTFQVYHHFGNDPLYFSSYDKQPREKYVGLRITSPPALNGEEIKVNFHMQAWIFPKVEFIFRLYKILFVFRRRVA